MVDVQYEKLAGAPIIRDSTYHYGPKGGSQGDPLSKLLMVGNMGGIRPKKTNDKKHSAYVVLNSTSDSPWNDEHDLEKNIITYHGDNNKPDVDPSTSFGNKWLLRIFKESDRKNTVPILLFKSVDDEGGPKGVKKFIGVAVPAIDESGSPIYWLDTSSGYSNYVFKMRILDTGSTDL